MDTIGVNAAPITAKWQPKQRNLPIRRQAHWAKNDIHTLRQIPAES